MAQTHIIRHHQPKTTPMTQAPKRNIAINELGRRIGETHHNARSTNGEVELLLTMHEDGWGYRRLAAKFEVSKSLVRDIVKGRRRGQTPCGWKVIQG